MHTLPKQQAINSEITFTDFYNLNFQSLKELVEINPESIRKIAREITGNNQAGPKALQDYLRKNPLAIQKVKAAFFIANIGKIAEIYQTAPMVKLH